MLNLIDSWSKLTRLRSSTTGSSSQCFLPPGPKRTSGHHEHQYYKSNKSLSLPVSHFTLTGICTVLRNTPPPALFYKENSGVGGAVPARGSGSNLISTRYCFFLSHTWATSVSHTQPNRNSLRRLCLCVSFHFILTQHFGTKQHMCYVYKWVFPEQGRFTAYRERRSDEIWSPAVTLHLPGCVRPCRSRAAFQDHLR